MLSILTLPRLPADRDGLRSVAFKADPAFAELAKRFGITPTRLAALLAQMAVSANPQTLILARDGIDPRSFI